MFRTLLWSAGHARAAHNDCASRLQTTARLPRLRPLWFNLSAIAEAEPDSGRQGVAHVDDGARSAAGSRTPASPCIPCGRTLVTKVRLDTCGLASLQQTIDGLQGRENHPEVITLRSTSGAWVDDTARGSKTAGDSVIRPDSVANSASS